MKIEMKKIFTTLAALLIVSVGFAQLPANTKLLTPNQEKNSISVELQPRTMNKDAKMSGSFWYNYGYALNNYAFGNEARLTDLSLFTDSMASVNYSDLPIPGRPQVYSVLQVFNLLSDTWSTFYDYYEVNGVRVEIPNVRYINDGNTFSVDSVSVEVVYFRGDSVPASVVDTLVISIASAIEPRYSSISTGGVAKYLSYSDITYDPIDCSMAPSALYERFEVIKIPLTEANHYDQNDPNSRYFSAALENFQNITGKFLLVSKGMISGIPLADRDTNMILGTDLNQMRALFISDVRPEFRNPLGGPIGEGFLTEYNLSMQASECLFAPNLAIFAGQYAPDAVWAASARRYAISALISCTDCAGISVNDITAKNITVRPNPATNNFTVELDDDSQAQVQLFNLVGQAVYNAQTNNQTVNVNVSNLNSGVYMLKVTQNGKVYTSKVLVQ